MEALLVAGDFAAVPRQVTRASAVVALSKHVPISGDVVATVVVSAPGSSGRRSATPASAMVERLANEGRDRLEDGVGVIGEILLRQLHRSRKTGSGNWLHFGPSVRIGDELRRHLRVELLHAGMMLPGDRLRHFLGESKIGRWFRWRDRRRKLFASVKDGLENHRIFLGAVDVVGVMLLIDGLRFFEKM